MKKILIVNHYATPPMYGGLNRHHYFARYLKEAGYDVKILASSAIHNSNVNMIDKNEKVKYKEKTIDGVDYIYVKTMSYNNKIKRVFNMLQYYFKSKKVAKKIGDFDVIYSSSPQPLSVLAALRIAKQKGAKSIVEVRDLWPQTIVDLHILGKNNPIVKVLYKVEEYMYKKADDLIFTIEGGIEYVKNRQYSNKIDLKKIHYINNGIDLKENADNKKNYVLKDKDLDNKNTFKVIYTGSIRQVYNINELVDLAKLIQEKEKNNIEFLIYGKGPYLEELQNRCVNERINNIKFKGFVDSKYLPYILSKANITLMHSTYYDCLKYGTSQNKMFLYLASGKPIISTTTSKYDIVKKYKCGISLNNDYKLEDYYQAIMKIYNSSKEDYKKYCDNCLKAVKEFDYKELTNKLINVIEGVK